MGCYSRSCCFGFCYVSLIVLLLAFLFVLVGAIFQTSSESAHFDSLLTINPTRSKCVDLCGLNFLFSPSLEDCCTSHMWTNCKTKRECLDGSIKEVGEKRDREKEGLYLFVGISAGLMAMIGLVTIVRRREGQVGEWEGDLWFSGVVDRLRRRERPREEKNEKFESFLYEDVEGTCGICLNVFEDEKSIRLPCQHIFHSVCIRKWLQVN
jgi:hypothetical protein